MKSKIIIYFVVIGAVIPFTNLPSLAMAEYAASGISLSLVGGILLILGLLSLAPVIMFSGPKHPKVLPSARRKKRVTSPELFVEGDETKNFSSDVSEVEDDTSTTYVELGDGFALYHGSLLYSDKD